MKRKIPIIALIGSLQIQAGVSCVTVTGDACGSIDGEMTIYEKVQKRHYEVLPDSIKFHGAINQDVSDIQFVGGEYARYICMSATKPGCQIQRGLNFANKTNRIMIYGYGKEAGLKSCELKVHYCDKPDSTIKSIVLSVTLVEAPSIR